MPGSKARTMNGPSAATMPESNVGLPEWMNWGPSPSVETTKRPAVAAASGSECRAGTPISAPPLLVQIGSGHAPLNGATPVRQTGASSLPSPRAWSETAETRHEAVFSCKPFTTNYLQGKYINRSALKFYGLNERHWGLALPRTVTKKVYLGREGMRRLPPMQPLTAQASGLVFLSATPALATSGDLTATRYYSRFLTGHPLFATTIRVTVFIRPKFM